MASLLSRGRSALALSQVPTCTCNFSIAGLPETRKRDARARSVFVSGRSPAAPGPGAGRAPMVAGPRGHGRGPKRCHVAGSDGRPVPAGRRSSRAPWVPRGPSRAALRGASAMPGEADGARHSPAPRAAPARSRSMVALMLIKSSLGQESPLLGCGYARGRECNAPPAPGPRAGTPARPPLPRHGSRRATGRCPA